MKHYLYILKKYGNNINIEQKHPYCYPLRFVSLRYTTLVVPLKEGQCFSVSFSTIKQIKENCRPLRGTSEERL